MRTKNILNQTVREIASLLSVDEPTAKLLKKVIGGKMNPEGFKAVSKWVDQCYNCPREHELILCAVNQLLDNYGTESLDGPYVNSYHMHSNFLYSNTGEMYNNTIIFDCENYKYFIGNCGDVVEFCNL